MPAWADFGCHDAPMCERRIGWIRGINVGGRRRVPMAELREALVEAGLEDVATYIQSGNVLFTGGPASRDAAGATIAAVVEERFDLDVPVVVRDVADLEPLLSRSAELFDVTDAETHDKRAAIGFCTEAPSQAAIESIDPDRSPPDTVVIEGEHALLMYPDGQASTKLTGDYLERTLGVGITIRNLSTVKAVVALATKA